MKWMLVTDSSCEYAATETDQMLFAKIPFTVTIGGADYVDDGSIVIPNMLDAMEACKEASNSSCPSPDAWLKKFMQADQCIAVTMSAGVSGTYQSALLGSQMALEQCPDKKIAVLDSRSAGSALSLTIRRAEALIARGTSFEDAVSHLQKYIKTIDTLFALKTFDNFVKSGRMSRFTGLFASTLGMWGVAGAKDGKVATKHKVRGPEKMMAVMLEEMEQRGFCGGEVFIAHCQNPEIAMSIKAKILAKWPKTSIVVMETGGLCSYYVERGGFTLAYRRWRHAEKAGS